MEGADLISFARRQLSSTSAIYSWLVRAIDLMEAVERTRG
jgi:hypothetical protein